MRPFLVRATVGVLLATALAGAEEPARVEGGLAASAWRLERLTLADGRTLEGLALDTADDDVGFIEVVRRPGRPMHLVARRLPAAGVRSVDRLPAAEHAALAARVEAFRANSLEDRDAVAAVRLTRRGEDGPWCYAGPLFDVESSAGQQLTRMAIVRLESLLDAFERLVPAVPAATGGRRLSVRLCGSQSEYAGVQAERGVSVANPAFYLPASSLLVAGGDVPAVIEQARRAADGLDATLQRQSDLDEEVTAGLRGLAEQLQAQGIPASRRAEIVALTRARRQREKAAVVAHVEQARRANDARVDQARGEFLRWLAHETWHAYADLRLGDRGGLPPWLDEGLAQVFEGGLLEAGELRLDAPDGERLARLASLLAGRPDVTLLPLVTGGDRQFLVGHGTGPASSREAYLLAWGVAYDLALGSPVLSAQALAALATPSAAPHADGVARFERLVRMPLADYTAGWRDRMLALARRPRRVTAPAQEGGPPAPAIDAARPAVPGR